MRESDIMGELATIERAMGDRQSEYWRGPTIEGETVMARRYRALIGTRAEGGESAGAPAPMAATEEPAGPCWSTSTGAAVQAEWHKSGGVDKNFAAARQFADEALAALPQESRHEFVSQLDGLPASAHAAIAAELANPHIRVAPVSAEHVRHFAETPEGAELLKAWASDAPLRIAKLSARLGRIGERMPAAERDAFAYFANHVSGAEFAALATYLTK